jgi:WD40 repeat protein
VAALAFDPEGRILAVVGGDGARQVKFCDVKTGERLPMTIDNVFPGTRLVTELLYSKNGKLLAVRGSGPGAACTFDAATGKRLADVGIPTESMRSLDFNRDASLIATTSTESRVHIWDAATGKKLHTFGDFDVPIMTVAFHPDNRRLAIGGGGGLVQILELPESILQGR